MSAKTAVRRLLRSLFLLPLLATLAGTPAASANTVAAEYACSTVSLPVRLVAGGAQNLTMVGTYCRPTFITPKVVQLLVHGSTYDGSMWDWPQQPDIYSYMRVAVRAGYATFSVDRIGAGASSKPPSGDVTIPNGAVALQDVVAHLRAGRVGGTAFGKVVWVGHSLGAVYGYEHGGRFGGVDAYVFIGSVHFVKPSWLGLMTSSVVPAGPDSGYLTTIPGMRDELFYRTANADPAVIAQDEAQKGTIVNSEIVSALALVNATPDAALTQRIQQPVAVFMGEYDNLACGPPDGWTCTAAEVRAKEAPYFRNASRFDAYTISGIGHSLPHLNAPAMFSSMLNWTRQVAPPL